MAYLHPILIKYNITIPNPEAPFSSGPDAFILNPEVSLEDIASAMQELVAEQDKQLAISKDLLIRRAAEFENYKKRTEKERTEIMGMANEMFLKKILPVYENVEREVESLSDETTTIEDIDNGIRSTYKLFQNCLAEFGISEMDVLNKEFNVDYMDAVMAVPASPGNENKVTKVVEKGYFIGDKVLRHAKVIVAK